MKIDWYVHRCIAKDVEMAGSKVAEPVTVYDMDNVCEHCGEPMATTDDIVRHIYSELTTS